MRGIMGLAVSENSTVEQNKVVDIVNSLIWARIGHKYLDTTGSQVNASNNLPVIDERTICVWNGISVSAERIEKPYAKLAKDNTEIIPFEAII